mgnify:CR=1 FL=1
MYFGAPVWPLQWNPPYDDTIRRVAAMGFKGVELIGWNRESLTSYYTKQEIGRLRKLISELNMRVTNFNHTPGRMTSENKEERRGFIDDFKRAIDVAAELESPFCTMCSQFPFGYDYPDFPPLRYAIELQKWSYSNANMNRDWNQNWKEYVAAMKELCQYAATQNIRVLVEPHPYRWVNSAQSMQRLIDHVQEDNLGFNFDPSHMFPCGDMPEWSIYAMKGRLWHTHFSDNDTITNAHWRPGQGKMNWKPIMQALKDIGYDGAINFELEDVPGAATPGSASAGMSNEMEEELAESKAYITKICKDLNIVLE